MEPQILNNGMVQQNPAPTVQKRCNHIPIIVILAILAVGGLVFGGFEFYQNLQNKSEKQEYTTHVEIEQTESIKLPEVRELLDKFIVFSLNTGDGIFTDGLTDFYKYYMAIENLDLDYDNAEDFFGEEQYAIGKKFDITYDDINNSYHELFGKNSNVKNFTIEEGTNIGSFCGVPRYSAEYSAYVSHTLCGGVDPSLYIYEVLDYTEENAILTVKILYARYNEKDNYYALLLNDGEQGGVGDLRSYEDQLPKYSLTFTKEDGKYVFTDIQKISEE